MMEARNNTPVTFFDIEKEREQGIMSLRGFSIPDTSREQQVLLYARLNNHSTSNLADLDETMFDGYDREIFKSIKQVSGGNDHFVIDAVLASVMSNLDEPSKLYCRDTYFKTPTEFAFDFDVIGVDNQVRKGNIEQCRNAVLEAANRRKILNAAISMINARDTREAARFAKMVSHADNVLSGEEFTASQTFERRKYLFSYNGAALGQTHNFYTLMGAQKSGKSHIFAVLLCASLYGECCGFKYMDQTEPTVLYFDTEQDTADAQEIIHTVNVLANKPVTTHPSNLHCFTLAHTPREKVFDFIAEKVEKYTPTIIFIDGYGGMVADVNDPKCSGVVNDVRVLAQSKGCSIFGIVHTTPTAAVLKALGVFGSELQRWGAGTFLNEKNENYFKMSAFELRKGGDVTPFYYKLMTSIVCDGAATPTFDYTELQDQLNHIGKHQNDVEILAIPTPIDADEAEAQETLKAMAIKQEREEKKRKKDIAELQSKFCSIYGGDESLAMTRPELVAKFVSRFLGDGKPATDKKQAYRKIEAAENCGVLLFDRDTERLKYLAPPTLEDE